MQTSNSKQRKQITMQSIGHSLLKSFLVYILISNSMLLISSFLERSDTVYQNAEYSNYQDTETQEIYRELSLLYGYFAMVMAIVLYCILRALQCQTISFIPMFIHLNNLYQQRPYYFGVGIERLVIDHAHYFILIVLIYDLCKLFNRIYQYYNELCNTIFQQLCARGCY